MRWHGVFRPRLRAREAFEALIELLIRIGHPEPKSRLPKVPLLRGSRSVGLRRVSPELLEPLRHFLDGESDVFLAELFEQLLESRAARREAAEVQNALRVLARFHRRDAVRLREARRIVGRGGAFVPQAERDALFIQARIPIES
jgi:hypothetical protein